MNLDHLPPDLADYATQVAASAGMTLRDVAGAVDATSDEMPPVRALRAGWACPTRDGGHR